MTVPRVDAASLTRDEFERRFAQKNLPVLLTNATASWRASREWVDAAGEPDVAALATLFGDHVVAVHARGGAPREMTVAEYAKWWSRRRREEPWCYLKDWRLSHVAPEYGAYETPKCLGEDWLSEYRFVYVGPAGSTTGLHADVLFSHSWSANVRGCPPNAAHQTLPTEAHRTSGAAHPKTGRWTLEHRTLPTRTPGVARPNIGRSVHLCRWWARSDGCSCPTHSATWSLTRALKHARPT
jgi:hypothetical protein